jgi:hypothetical protein
MALLLLGLLKPFLLIKGALADSGGQSSKILKGQIKQTVRKLGIG